MSERNPINVTGLALLALFSTALPAFGQVCRTPIQVTVHSVLAADTNEGIDGALQPMSRQLNMLFRYSTYRLVSAQAELAQCGKMISFNLPGGRILDVEPRGIDSNMIAMEVLMFQGERPVMSTDLKLTNGGVLMIGGHRYEKGMLIISVGAATIPATTESPATPVGHSQTPGQ